jgi:hypothetical protein
MAVELNTTETGVPPQTPENGCTGGATSTPPVQKLATPHGSWADEPIVMARAGRLYRQRLAG